MSPQITAAKVQGKAAYDGTKADVWAMGVLLCVMLIGEGTGARGAQVGLQSRGRQAGPLLHSDRTNGLPSSAVALPSNHSGT